MLQSPPVTSLGWTLLLSPRRRDAESTARLSLGRPSPPERPVNDKCRAGEAVPITATRSGKNPDQLIEAEEFDPGGHPALEICVSLYSWFIPIQSSQREGTTTFAPHSNQRRSRCRSAPRSRPSINASSTTPRLPIPGKSCRFDADLQGSIVRRPVPGHDPLLSVGSEPSSRPEGLHRPRSTCHSRWPWSHRARRCGPLDPACVHSGPPPRSPNEAAPSPWPAWR